MAGDAASTRPSSGLEVVEVQPTMDIGFAVKPAFDIVGLAEQGWSAAAWANPIDAVVVAATPGRRARHVGIICQRRLTPEHQILHSLGWLSLLRGDSAGARGLLEESLRLFQRLADAPWKARVMTRPAYVCFMEGDYARAMTLAAESATVARVIGDRHYSAAPRPPKKGVQVHALSLVEAEVLDSLCGELGIELAGHETRRNVLTRGVRLNDLIGRQCTVGGMLCEGGTLPPR